MLDKILDFIADKMAKPITYKPVKTVKLSATKNTNWTATEDGMMVVRISPTGGGVTSYCYIDYRHDDVPATAGGYGISYNITTAGNQMTQCIPMVKGGTYGIFDIANVKQVSLFLYPFEKIGGVLSKVKGYCRPLKRGCAVC